MLGLEYEFRRGGFLGVDYGGRHVMVQVSTFGVNPELLQTIVQKESVAAPAAAELEQLYAFCKKRAALLPSTAVPPHGATEHGLVSWRYLVITPVARRSTGWCRSLPSAATTPQRATPPLLAVLHALTRCCWRPCYLVT